MVSPEKQVEMPRKDIHEPWTSTIPRCRMRIHLAFGVVGVVALLCEGLVLYFLLTAEFNESLDQMIKMQQNDLLLGAKTTMMDKVNGWLKLSVLFADKFQRRLSLDPSMYLCDVWKPAFEANVSVSDTEGVALANAVQFDDSVAVIAIHRDGSNYKGDPSKPVDYNLSDTTVFAYFHRIFNCPVIVMRGEGNDVRYYRYCYDFETGKATKLVGYTVQTDENGLDRRFAVEFDQEALWNRIKAAEGRFTFEWLYFPLTENYTPLQFNAVKMHQLSDGRNISASVINTAEDIAEEIVSQMCFSKWDVGEFCESLMVGHLKFDILTWGSNVEVSGVVNDIEQFSNTSAIRMVYLDLDSQVHNTEDSFDDVILGRQVGPWLYSAERIFRASNETADDGGSIWIILIYDRDEIYEESDAVTQTAIVTLIVSMAVSVFIYVLILGYYISRISNLRRTLRTIQSAPPEESTELVDKFVDNSRIYEVYQIANEFASVIHALADANKEKRMVQEEQLTERVFLAYMSHHIRTPLHGVLGMCEVVLVRTKESETKEYLDTVMQCGNSLLVLLNDSIDLSRMQADKMDIEVGPVDVAKVLQVVSMTFETQLQRAGRDLRTVNASGQDLYCMADSARLVQVATNLVSNAIKYSKGWKQCNVDARNPVYISIHLWVSSEAAVMTKLLGDAATHIPGGNVAFHAPDVLTKQVGKPPIAGIEYVVISVTDFGRGIPKNKLVKLFSPFAQMRTEDSECGAGLGLNMCFHVAILLGGFTGVISREGRGSIFYIAVPATTAPKLDCVEEKTNEEMHESDTIVVDKDNDMVLVVDDTKVNRLILSRHLESLGLRSIQACDGQEAVDLVIQHNGHFRYVFTDLDMPVMDGLTAASLIKRDYPDLPIMCVSANSTPKDVQMAKEAGCVGLLGKPFTRIMLKKAVAMMS